MFPPQRLPSNAICLLEAYVSQTLWDVKGDDGSLEYVGSFEEARELVRAGEQLWSG